MKSPILINVLSFSFFCMTAQVNFTINSTGCTGNSYTLNANTGTSSATGYTWTSSPQIPVFSSANSSITSIQFPAAGNFTINLAVQLTSGTASAMNTIAISATPVLTITQTSFTTCITNNLPKYSKPVVLTASGASSYTWYPYDPFDWSITPNSPSKTVRPIATTCFTANGSSPSGCTGSAVVCLTVIPRFTFNVDPGYGIICLPDSLRLSAVNVQSTAIGPTSAFSYSWTEGLNAPPPSLSSNLGQTVIAFPKNNTTYTVEVFDANKCVSIPALVNVTVNCTGINEKSIEEPLVKIIPNPVSYKLSIEMTDIENAVLSDLTGRLLGSYQSNEIDMNVFPPAIYILKVQTPKGSKFFKVVKE